LNSTFNPLNVKLNPICHLLALLGAHPIFHVSRIRVKLDGKSNTLEITKDKKGEENTVVEEVEVKKKVAEGWTENKD
jgi:hypothetical protein